MDQTVDSLLKVISVQFSHSVVSNSLWSHGLQHNITSSRNLLKLMSSDLVKPSKHLIHIVPFLSHLQYFPASGPFKNESVVRIRCPKYWSFSFSISTSNEYSGLIYFRMDRLNLLEVKGTLKTLLQNHSLKDQLFDTAFFIVQLSHPHITNGKSIALTRQSFVGKVMSLLFNMLSRLVITFLPRSKRLLISWLESPSAVTFGAPQNKSLLLFPLFPHLFAMKWWDRTPWS